MPADERALVEGDSTDALSAARVLLTAQRALADARREAEKTVAAAKEEATAIVAGAQADAAERAAAQQEIVRLWAEVAAGDRQPDGVRVAPYSDDEVRRLLHEVLWVETHREQELLSMLRAAQVRLHEELEAAMDGVEQAQRAREALAARVDELLAERLAKQTPMPDYAELTSTGVAVPWPMALNRASLDLAAPGPRHLRPEGEVGSPSSLPAMLSQRETEASTSLAFADDGAVENSPATTLTIGARQPSVELSPVAAHPAPPSWTPTPDPPARDDATSSRRLHPTLHASFPLVVVLALVVAVVAAALMIL